MNRKISSTNYYFYSIIVYFHFASGFHLQFNVDALSLCFIKSLSHLTVPREVITFIFPTLEHRSYLP